MSGEVKVKESTINTITRDYEQFEVEELEQEQEVASATVLPK